MVLYFHVFTLLCVYSWQTALWFAVKLNSLNVLPFDAERWQGTSGFQWLSFLSKPLPRCAVPVVRLSRALLLSSQIHETNLFFFISA